MVNFGRFISKLLKRVDLFPTSQFMRYKGSSDYTTTTGGFVSVVVIIVFLVLFASMALKTVNREIINTSVSVSNQIDPSPVEIVVGPNGGFMFAVGVYGINLNSPLKLFNITMKQSFIKPVFEEINSTVVPLVQCTQQHFNFNEQIASLYTRFRFVDLLCPPLDYKLSVGGKVISPVSSKFSVTLGHCNRTIDPSCAFDANVTQILSKIGQFTMVIPLIYNIINAGDQQYKTLYLQDRNFFSFTPTLGVSAKAYIQQQEIDTDISILPFTEQVVEKLVVVPEVFQTSTVAVSSNVYVNVDFVKSGTFTLWNRSFNKVDAYFSYVGGLVGIIISLIFILNTFSERSYEISIASHLFLSPDQNPIPAKRYNFFYYLATVLKDFLGIFKVKTQWKQTDLFIKCSQEMENQLDIYYILKRLIFLQRAVEILFSQKHHPLLYLQKKMTIDEAEEIRKKYDFPTKLKGTDLSKANQSANIDINQSDFIVNREPQKMDSRQLIKIQGQNNENQSDGLSDASSISSINTNSLNELKAVIVKVNSQSKKGDQISRKVMQNMDQRVYHLQRDVIFDFQQPDNNGTDQSPNLRKIEDSKQDSKMKDFEYNFDV